MKKTASRTRPVFAGSDVRAYCVEHGIQSYVADAISLARQTFRPIRSIEARLQADPDSDEQRVVIDVTVDCEISVAVSMKQRFTQTWVKCAPPEVREQIRLLYHLA